MVGINLKVLLAMVTNCALIPFQQWHAACHAPEICILHISANFEKSKTQFFSNK